MNAIRDDEYDETTTAAIRRWWDSYGRTWVKVKHLVGRGWELDDILQEVLLSSMTKSRGKSRWDPARANVDAWAGLIGRSRVGHLLERRVGPRPLALDHTYMTDGEPEQLVDRIETPMDWDAMVPRRPSRDPVRAERAAVRKVVRRAARREGCAA